MIKRINGIYYRENIDTGVSKEHTTKKMIKLNQEEIKNEQ